jgi:hypothetical protein
MAEKCKLFNKTKLPLVFSLDNVFGTNCLILLIYLERTHTTHSMPAHGEDRELWVMRSNPAWV